MAHLRVDDHFLVLSVEVVEGSEVGMRRAGAVLETAAGEHGARDLCRKILGVVVRKECVHLLVSHRTLVVLRHISWPRHDVEIVRIVAEESHVAGNRGERIVAESCARIRKRTALA